MSTPFPARRPDGADLLERIREAAELLERIAVDRTVLEGVAPEDRRRLLRAAAEVLSPDRNERRRVTRAVERERREAKVRSEEDTLGKTGIRLLRERPLFTTPNVFPPEGFAPDDVAPGATAEEPDAREAVEPRHCYVCKSDFEELHHFYDQLCPRCAELNFRKRGELADLSGRVALLTGGRVKIGYQAGLKLLRSGARLVVTTRFPRDAASRYAREADFDDWKDRLEVFGLDLRHTPSVEAFCREMLKTHDRLDFIVNNACQTVRRPPEFYEHMMEGETAAKETLPAPARKLLGSWEGLRATRVLPESGTTGAAAPPAHAPGMTHAAELSQVRLLAEELPGQRDLFPEGRLDADLQQVDLRDRNSWRLLLAEVSSVELLEVHLVNAIAPFVLNARLKPLMTRTPGRAKHVVNVSAVEGQFYRKWKTTRHPHTNMAKAALNMMTRTAATDYHADGIHMNSVDTGWITDEDPHEIAARKRADQRFHPPLDSVDGGARIVDPIIDGFNTGRHVWGQFLKDYEPTDW